MIDVLGRVHRPDGNPWGSVRGVMRDAGLPVIKNGGSPVLFHLDLRGIVIRLTMKSVVFYDCDLCDSVLCGDMMRCQFVRCDMRGCMFLGAAASDGDRDRAFDMSLGGEETGFWFPNAHGWRHLHRQDRAGERRVVGPRPYPG